ncbi:MAG TPA: isoprenyl transferase [Gammaproteobacteria bacterium]|nr:isoprenyl transferase [Gammaproteobacteria bacterium]
MPASQPPRSQPSMVMPRHVAIIMDGNGRWARQRRMPRIAGHRAGVKSVRRVLEQCLEYGIEALTVFAFSTENWRRPQKEVGLLMDLFLTSLEREVQRLHQHDVRVRIIGDRSRFPAKLQNRIAEAERLTAGNSALTFTIAANYGGRWDITQAVRRLAESVERGELRAGQISEELLQGYLELADLPEPDLFIRTGGEQRVSNFLLWQLAYTEFYFTDTLWPDFDKESFLAATESFAARERRFGRTSEQVERQQGAQ